MNAAQAAEYLAARLLAAGISATVDERNLNPPAVLVGPPAMAGRFGRGWTASWTLAAVVPNTGRGQALRALGELVADVQDALGPVQLGRPFDFSAPDGAAPMPGYELTYTQQIPPTEGTP